MPIGARASLTARAAPNAGCTISYTTPLGNRSGAQGLVPRNADGSGVVNWTWVIGTGTQPGTGSVSVTCSGSTSTIGIVITTR